MCRESDFWAEAYEDSKKELRELLNSLEERYNYPGEPGMDMVTNIINTIRSEMDVW